MLSYGCGTQRATFPAECFVITKQWRALSASRTRNAVVTRFDAAAADGARLRIDQCQGSVKGVTGEM